MSSGMIRGLGELHRWNIPNAVSRMVLITDGLTHKDADRCRQLARDAAAAGISIITLGVGSDWDESLLNDISQLSGGPPAQRIQSPEDAVEFFNQQVKNNIATVVHNTVLTLRSPAGITFRKAVKALPNIQNIDPAALSEYPVVIPLGNWQQDTVNYVLLELMVNPSSAGHSRIIQADLAYDIPVAGTFDAHLREDINIDYTAGPNQGTQINAPVRNPVTTISKDANPGVICNQCGYRNRPGAKFCKQDGQPLVPGSSIPIQARPIQARPVQSGSSLRQTPIQARPVQSGSSPQAQPTIRARPVTTNSHTSGQQAVYDEGLQLLKDKNHSGAIAYFKLAQSQGDNSYTALYYLGYAYRQYGESLKESDQSLFKQNTTMAAEYFEEALKVKQDASEAAFQLGLCYRDLELSAQAINAFRKALVLAPKDEAIYHQLGLIALERHAYREAEAFLTDGLKLDPDHALMLMALGQVYSETKQLPAAINMLRQATQLDPNIWRAWYYLGQAHMKLKEWKMALSALERARQLNVSEVDIYIAMATTYLKLHEKHKTRQMLDEALKYDPVNADALRLQRQL
ncbi:tetratricopeptide repeat protein [Dictyobacter kobayashii]|uniref:VWFA domain-containing protein n=1 Tax=Dictyobacter kobayashii TaxID=2014872 RepID=A0A402AQK4_9CHLR|nr:tetratricopeptide repeat protein [Dictyobacter kobayashii]GCE21300.1 hypothetical protein KDK_51000 [Dictyobacter kobayashii]